VTEREMGRQGVRVGFAAGVLCLMYFLIGRMGTASMNDNVNPRETAGEGGGGGAVHPEFEWFTIIHTDDRIEKRPVIVHIPEVEVTPGENLQPQGGVVLKCTTPVT
jgi:hypothetical protein